MRAVIVAAIYFPLFAESIIDTTAFNFRVRNGTGWFHGVKPPQLLNTFYFQDIDIYFFFLKKKAKGLIIEQHLFVITQTTHKS